MKMEVKNLPTGTIKPNPFEVRSNIDLSSENFQNLLKSIKRNGIIQPITVRKHNGNYQVIAGTRRLTASKKAKINTIPAVIRQLNNVDARILSLTENSHRKDLTDLEMSIALQKIYDEAGFTLESAIKNVKQYDHYLERGGEMDIPEDFIEVCENIADGVKNQYVFLRLAKDLTPSTLAFTQKLGLTRAKKLMLTRPTISKSSKLQRTVAVMIKNMDDKPARQLVHNIETGNYKFTGKSFKVSGGGEKINMEPQEFTEDARMYYVINTGLVNDILSHFTNSNQRIYSDELVERNHKFILEKINQVNDTDLLNWYNALVPLINLMPEIKKMMDSSFKRREKSEKLYSR